MALVLVANLDFWGRHLAAGFGSRRNTSGESGWVNMRFNKPIKPTLIPLSFIRGHYGWL